MGDAFGGTAATLARVPGRPGAVPDHDPGPHLEPLRAATRREASPGAAPFSYVGAGGQYAFPPRLVSSAPAYREPAGDGAGCADGDGVAYAPDVLPAPPPALKA